jgi:hypothetical protein
MNRVRITGRNLEEFLPFLLTGFEGGPLGQGGGTGHLGALGICIATRQRGQK